jgi:hypothetical protein
MLTSSKHKGLCETGKDSRERVGHTVCASICVVLQLVEYGIMKEQGVTGFGFNIC